MEISVYRTGASAGDSTDITGDASPGRTAGVDANIVPVDLWWGQDGRLRTITAVQPFGPGAGDPDPRLSQWVLDGTRWHLVSQTDSRTSGRRHVPATRSPIPLVAPLPVTGSEDPLVAPPSGRANLRLERPRQRRRRQQGVPVRSTQGQLVAPRAGLAVGGHPVRDALQPDEGFAVGALPEHRVEVSSVQNETAGPGSEAASIALTSSPHTFLTSAVRTHPPLAER